MNTRREFVKQIGGCAALCAGGTLAFSFLQGCTSLTFVAYQKEGNELIVNTDVFGDDKYVLINPSELPKPVYLVKDGNGYKAIYMECTHKNVQLRPGGGTLSCPAHGSEFDSHGKVLNGPAEEGLKEFKTTLKQDKIHVLLKS